MRALLPQASRVMPHTFPSRNTSSGPPAPKPGASRSKPSWAHYTAAHNWSIAKVYAEDIVVNDTSTAIIEVDADGNMDGPTNPHQVARFLTRCEEVGAKAAGVYVFSHDGPIDHATIQGVPR